MNTVTCICVIFFYIFCIIRLHVILKFTLTRPYIQRNKDCKNFFKSEAGGQGKRTSAPYFSCPLYIPSYITIIFPMLYLCLGFNLC